MNNSIVDINILSQALTDIVNGNSANYRHQHVNFIAEHGQNNYNKGLIFTGSGSAKQFILADNPDRFFSTENIDIAGGKTLSINSKPVITETSLGPTITQSDLTSVGRLKGLIVDGSLSINQNLFYFADSDRLAIGTEEPNAALSIAEDGIEIIVGTSGTGRAKVGTFAFQDFDIVSDNKPRITVGAGGDIFLGNRKSSPITVRVNGTVSVGVETPDPRVALHVNGAIKYNNTLHITSNEPPKDGTFNQGDIVWNNIPRADAPVGWICTRPGTPGVWNPFGLILPA